MFLQWQVIYVVETALRIKRYSRGKTVFISFATKAVKFVISKLGSSIEYFVYNPLIPNLPSHKCCAVVQVLA